MLVVCLAACNNLPQGNRANDNLDSSNEEHIDPDNAHGEQPAVETNNTLDTLSTMDNQTDNEYSNELKYNPKLQHITLPLTTPTPSDEEVLALYYHADQIAEMFENTYFNFSDDSSIDIDGVTYYKVIDDTYHSIADLEVALKTIFSDSMKKILINNGRYYESDGELYTLCADKGGNINNGASTYEIIKEPASKIVFLISTETIDFHWEEDPPYMETIGYKTHDMILEYLDGKWLFTQFYMFGYYDSFNEFIKINSKKG